ncbi:hypothetical protein CDAR_535501 [Caerostris darwini]|uniref:Uncharacterized protein n=1 Tax=Caerostris darwini TaxID=1538125 RepID=A0AAV4VSG0_9ARAC|nr:hypothetical protein CDAR_535501 [Caerostris darwini]
MGKKSYIALKNQNCKLTLLFCLLILTRKQRVADFAFFGISSEVTKQKRCVALEYQNCKPTLFFCLLILNRKQRVADFAFFGISSEGEIKELPSEEEIRRRCIAASWDPSR